MALAIFDSSAKSRPFGVPTISIGVSRRVRLNKEAAAIFQRADVGNVLILWDTEKRTFALSKAAKTDPRAYKLKYSPRGGASFAAKAFLRHINWTATRSVPLKVAYLKGMLQANIPAEFLEARAKSNFPEKKGNG